MSFPVTCRARPLCYDKGVRRGVKIVVLAVIILVGGFAAMAVGFSYPVTEAELSQQFIVAHPFDPAQVAALSQFRSCAGHDYRGPMAATGRVESTPRSLKHYVRVKPEYGGTMDAVPVFAPFDGTISMIDDDLGGPGDQQVWLSPAAANPASPRQWQFVFFHIGLDPSLREGSPVSAGQKIGGANLARGPQGATDNFDIAMKITRPLHRPAVDAVFHHMTPELLAEYARLGVTPADLIIPEEYRDAHDCPQLPQPLAGPEYDAGTVYFPPGAGSGEYVFLKHE